MYRPSRPLSKGQRGGRRQCTDTQDGYVKLRGEVGSQCTDTQNLYPVVRGEVGDRVQTLRTSMYRKEERRETLYRHSGLLCKGQMGGGNTV